MGQADVGWLTWRIEAESGCAKGLSGRVPCISSERNSVRLYLVETEPVMERCGTTATVLIACRTISRQARISLIKVGKLSKAQS